jgi:hypothetical protein
MADEDRTTERPIDESAIAPSQPNNTQRKNSLEHHLAHRPDKSELVESALPFLSAVEDGC